MRTLRLLILALLTLLVGGCGMVEDLAALYERYDSFGRRFITQFHEGGLPQARAFIKPETIRLGNADSAFASLRGRLPTAPIDSITEAGGEVEDGWFSGLGHLQYRVHGGDRVALVELWIERSGKRLFVETVRITNVTGTPAAEPPAGGHVPPGTGSP